MRSCLGKQQVVCVKCVHKYHWPPDLHGSKQENRACVDQAHTVTWSLWAEEKGREKTWKLPYNAKMTSDSQGMLCWFLVPIKTNNRGLFQFKTTCLISRSSASQKSCWAKMKGGMDPVPAASFGFLVLLWFVDPVTILQAWNAQVPHSPTCLSLVPTLRSPSLLYSSLPSPPRSSDNQDKKTSSVSLSLFSNNTGLGIRKWTLLDMNMPYCSSITLKVYLRVSDLTDLKLRGCQSFGCRNYL